MQIFYTPDIEKTLELPEDESGHCVRVLRKTIGDEVMLTDGKGTFYKARIADTSRKKCSVNIMESIRKPNLWNGHLHLALAPTKNLDRIEWLIEKATEIGLDEISFLSCRFSERKVIKTERIDKIVVSAMKQSLKAWKPTVHDLMSFNDFVRQDFPGQKFIAHCYNGYKPLLRDELSATDDALVLIGPEGDFSPEEVQLAESRGFKSISLGASRLRTETAALVAVHLMNLAHT